MNMPLRRGIHLLLEDAANGMLKESMKGITRHADKSDVLTPWKEQDRRRREVYVPSGTPDAANRSGVFHRSTNPSSPHLNSRDGRVRGRRISVPHSDMPAEYVPIDRSSTWDQE